MSLADNIKRLRKMHGYTQYEFAKMLHVSPNSVSAWEIGRNKPLMDKITIMAKLFNVSTSEIIGDARNPTNMIAVTQVVNIPVIGQIACGDPILAEQNIDGYRAEIADRVPSGSLFFLRCKGNSMEPTISDGAYVLIKKQPEVEEGEIAAVLVDDQTEATLKRVHHQNGSIVLSGDNPTFPPIILNEKFPGRIIGKAIKVSFDL